MEESDKGKVPHTPASRRPCKRSAQPSNEQAQPLTPLGTPPCPLRPSSSGHQNAATRPPLPHRTPVTPVSTAHVTSETMALLSPPRSAARKLNPTASTSSISHSAAAAVTTATGPSSPRGAMKTGKRGKRRASANSSGSSVGDKCSSDRAQPRSSRSSTSHSAGRVTAASTSVSARKRHPESVQAVFQNWRATLRRQSWLSFILSFAYHIVHILIIISLVTSPLLMRSTTFSAQTLGRALLNAQGDLPKGVEVGSAGNKGKDGGTLAPLLPAASSVAVETVWAIHDELFFLEEGRLVQPASIADSFARRDARQRDGNSRDRGKLGGTNRTRNGGTGDGGRGASGKGDTDDHTYVTTARRDANKIDSSLKQKVVVEGDAVDPMQPPPLPPPIAHLVSPPPLPGRRLTDRKKTIGGKNTLSKLVAAWEASPLYSSPLALLLYYYLYCVIGAIVLCVGTQGVLTGHTSLIRLAAVLLELVWFTHHGGHSFVVYTWLLRLSHRSPAVRADEPFLKRGSPYAAVRNDGSVQFFWFYQRDGGKGDDDGGPIAVAKMDMKTYLYEDASTIGNVAYVMSAIFITVLVACLLKDFQRALDALAGLRSLKEPDGYARCPLCSELTEYCVDGRQGISGTGGDSVCDKNEESSVSKRRKLVRWLHSRRGGAFLDWLLCRVCRRFRRTTVLSYKSGAGPWTRELAAAQNMREALRGIDMGFYAPSRLQGSGDAEESSSESSSGSDSTDTSEEDEREGGLVKVIVVANATSNPSTAAAQSKLLDVKREEDYHHTLPHRHHEQVEGEGEAQEAAATAALKRRRRKEQRAAEERQYLMHTTRHVHHRCAKLHLDAEDADDSSSKEDEEEEETSSSFSSTASSSSESANALLIENNPSSAFAAFSPSPGRETEAGNAVLHGPRKRVVIKEGDNIVSYADSASAVVAAARGSLSNYENSFFVNSSGRRGGAMVPNYGATSMGLGGGGEERPFSPLTGRGEGSAVATSTSHFVQRTVYDTLRDADDEFRPGNAFPCLDKASTVARWTFNWLDPFITFAMIEPTLLRHERFLPALPDDYTSLEHIGIPAWRLWVFRKHWYSGLVSTPSAALLPTEEALVLLDSGPQQQQLFHSPIEEESGSSENRTVVASGRKRALSMTKLRPQRPKRSHSERLFLSITGPLSRFFAALFNFLYIDRSVAVQDGYRRLARGMLRDRLVESIRSEGGDLSYEPNAVAMAELLSTDDEEAEMLAGVAENNNDKDKDECNSESSAGCDSNISKFPSHLRHQLSLNDVSAFSLFLQHDSGRCFAYRAGPLLLLSEALRFCVIPVIFRILSVLVQKAELVGGDDDDTNNSVTSSDVESGAFMWCLLLVLLLTGQSLVFYAYWRRASEAALGATTAVRTMILEKTLALPLAQRTFDDDDVIALAAADAQLCGAALVILHRTWSYPLRAIVAALFIRSYLGSGGWLPALVLLAIACAAVPALRRSAHTLRQRQREMPSRSGRLACMREVLLHLRQAKSMLLEGLYARRVQRSLGREREGEQRVTGARAARTMAGSGTYVAIIFCTLAAYAYAQQRRQQQGGDIRESTLGLESVLVLVPALTVFALLWEPLTELPALFTSVARGYLAMKRVEGFLRQSPDEFAGTWMDLTLLDPEEQQRARQRRGAVVCQGSSFTWQHDLTPEDPRPLLRDVFMRIRPGELVVVQGPVGAGKSTLLLAILGEVNRCVREDALLSSSTYSGRSYEHPESEVSVVSLADVDSRGRFRVPGSVSSMRPSSAASSPRTVTSDPGHSSADSLLLPPVTGLPPKRVDTTAAEGGFSVFGTCVYCSQEPWLQNDTIRANITAGGLGQVRSMRWYRTVIRACALETDFDELERGDETVVGEKGEEELTASVRARVALARAVYSKADIYLLDGVLSPLDTATRTHIVRHVFRGLLKRKTVIAATNVGLAALQPHRIFTVVGTGGVREDTALYKSVARDDEHGVHSTEGGGGGDGAMVRSTSGYSRGKQSASAHSEDDEGHFDVDDGEEEEALTHATHEGDGEPLGVLSAQRGSVVVGGDGDTTASLPLPYLYGEEFEEAVVYETDVDNSASDDDDESSTSSTDGSADSSSPVRDGGGSRRIATTATTTTTTSLTRGSENNSDSEERDWGEVSESTEGILSDRTMTSDSSDTESEMSSAACSRTHLHSGHGHHGHHHHQSPNTLQVRPAEVVVAFLTWQFAAVLFLVIAQQCLFLGVDMWVALWLSEWSPISPRLQSALALLVGIFVMGVCSTLVFLPARVLACFRWIGGTMHAACARAVESVLRLPVPLMDGRTAVTVLNILAKDFSVALRGVPETINVLLGAVVQIAIVCAFNVCVNPFFLLLLPTASCLFCGVAHRAVVVTRELRRLETRSMSSTLTLLREALEGAPMVRCFAMQDTIREEYCHSLDTANSATVTEFMCDCWVGLRIRAVSVLLASLVAILGVLFAGPRMEPSLTGVAILLCMRVSHMLAVACSASVRVRAQWASLRRVLKLLRLPAEPLTTKGSATVETYYAQKEGELLEYSSFAFAAGSWHIGNRNRKGSCAGGLGTCIPNYGAVATNSSTGMHSVSSYSGFGLSPYPDGTLAISMNNVSARYRRGQPDGLLNFSLSMQFGERVGLVSRAGHGKSLVVSALQRLATPGDGAITGSCGSIQVRGEDVDAVPYPILRSWFAMIPPEPLALRETWRHHLMWGVGTSETQQQQDMGGGTLSSDTLPLYSDDALWSALAVVGLDAPVRRAGGLDTPVFSSKACAGSSVIAAGGISAAAVFQLLCLARAVLWRTPMVILEEASPGDSRVDAIVQRVMRAELRACTLLMIARRMATIEALCSRVVVLEDGEIVATLERSVEDVEKGSATFVDTFGAEGGTHIPKTLQDIVAYFD